MVHKQIYLCCCADYNKIKPEKLTAFAEAANSGNIKLITVADFCLEAVQNIELLVKINKDQAGVAACSSRVVEALFKYADVDAPDKIVSLCDNETETLIDSLNTNKVRRTPVADKAELPAYTNSWKAWFPIIDYDRCTNCGKCVDYCLFGVYQKNRNKVLVSNPRQCKTDCPACARMCPANAIIFPKHSEPHINGSEIQTDQIGKPELAGENLYDRLAQRRRSVKKQKLLKD